MYVCVFICFKCVCVHFLSVYMCMCVFKCESVCMCVCIYVFITVHFLCVYLSCSGDMSKGQTTKFDISRCIYGEREKKNVKVTR